MIVYGDSAPYGKIKVVDENTVPVATNFYGDSKLQADIAVRGFADDKFKVIVLRPPMIYGKGCKGNYPMLAKLAKKLPLFPDVDNERSMIHIDNLCEFLCQIMLIKELKQTEVVLFPQNAEWTKTSQMVKEIAEISGKKIMTMNIMKPVVAIGRMIPGKIGGLVSKAFGNSCYVQSMSEYEGISYRVVDFKTSIKRTEEFSNMNCMKSAPKALMLASVASMIDLFNSDNISILRDLGYDLDVAAIFTLGSITSQERVDKYREELIDKGVGVYNIPVPRSIRCVREIAKSYKTVKRLVDANYYQIVHCHSPIGSVICRLACRDARKHGTKVIYTAHGFHCYDGASRVAWTFFYPLEKECAKYTDVLITINQEDYKMAKTFASCNVEYIPGIGVHTSEFKNIVVDRANKRLEFGFGDEDFVFMSTGQLSIRKNHEIIIRALSLIDNSKVKYLIVGLGEENDRLKQLAKDLNISDRVIFAGYREDVKELLYSVDGFAFPSLQEGLPVALMEAMSVGLPIVCSRIRGNTDLIENGRGGFIYDCYDKNGFADGMKKIVSGVGCDMGKINVNTMKKFDTSEVNIKMRKIYMEMSE
jgi:glycosyltransferase involved in cell wall biosynthesis